MDLNHRTRKESQTYFKSANFKKRFRFTGIFDMQLGNNFFKLIDCEYAF